MDKQSRESEEKEVMTERVLQIKSSYRASKANMKYSRTAFNVLLPAPFLLS